VNYVIYKQYCVTSTGISRIIFISLNNFKSNKMKKAIFFVIVMIFTMSSTFTFAADKKSNSNHSAVPAATENKMSEVELSRLTNRAEEIRNLDKSNMTVKENRELKKEARDIDKNVAKRGGAIYIGGATLILLIILIILLV